MARVSNSGRVSRPVDSLTLEVLEYKTLRDEIESLEKRKRELRDSLMDAVKAAGEADTSGHIWLSFEDEDLPSLQAERRVTQTLNQDRAQVFLEDRGLTDRCTTLVRIVDEDAVMAARYEDLLSDEDIEAMFDEKVTWALKLK